MTKDEKLQAVLNFFIEEANAVGDSPAVAYARMCGWLMSWATEDVAEIGYNYYLENKVTK
jgi:hypothetical protein